MKNYYALALGLVWTANAVGQGTFQNMDFEQAIVPFVPPGNLGSPVATSNGIPYWIAYLNSAPIPTIFHDDVAGGGAAVSIHDSSSIYVQPLQGLYTAALQGSGFGPPTSASIAQTGQVPAASASIRFWATPLSNLQVTFAGQSIPLLILASTPGYNVLGGDISAFAGQSGELRLTGLANAGGVFDNIQFSNEPIPEPGVISFLIFALGLLGIRRCNNSG